MTDRASAQEVSRRKFLISRGKGCKRLVIAVILLGLVATVIVYHVLPDYRTALREQRAKAGIAVVDRNGRLLRLFPDPQGHMSLWGSIEDFPKSLKAAVVAAEDRRFYDHPGFDPIAVLRALYTNITRWKTVSGASTITEQVVRLIQPRPRTYYAKCVELLCAVKMELQLTKEQILELHLNLSPMGGSIRGAGLASRIYFGKNVGRITLCESAILAALPRSPTRYSPRTSEGRRQLFEEKDRILGRMERLDYITSSQVRLNRGPKVAFANRPVPLEAPHLVDFVLANDSHSQNVIKTTLDLTVQHSVQRVLRSHRDSLGGMGITQAAAIIADTRTMDVLAMVGSLRYGPDGQGYNNGATAPRSAGSTLKPFLYALALEKGYNAFSEIPDTMRSYSTPHGNYLPANADRTSYGPVNIRNALGNSLNISAVKVARWVGVEDILHLLESVGIASASDRSPEYYGLGIAIGNLEVNLYRLVQAYGTLAGEGEFRPLNVLAGEKPPGRRIFSPESVYIINNILADPSARLLTFGNPHYFDFGLPVSLKTGTSSNFRDTWIVAYTPRHVIGIWTGNFSGSPTNGATGSGACGPILFDVIASLYCGRSPGEFSRPETVKEIRVCSMSGKQATSRCPHSRLELIVDGRRPGFCDLPHDTEHHFLGADYAQWLHRRDLEQGLGRYRLMRSGSSSPAPSQGIEIVSPHNLDRYIYSPEQDNRVLFRAVPKKVVREVIWFVDGVEIVRTPPPYEFFWELSRGLHEIHAVTPGDEGDLVTILVE